MTAKELAEVEEAVKLLLPPAGIATTFNGVTLSVREPLRVVTATLPTLIADDEGVLRPTQRSTTINVHHVDGQAWLYEMGIPVVETELPYSLDVAQKVPLNADRDNVTAAYSRRLATLVLNELHDEIDSEVAAAPWVATALEDPNVDMRAVANVLHTRFGEQIATIDPNDTESNSQAIARGYAVLHGGQFSREAWVNIRASGAAPSAGSLFPTPRTGDGQAVRIDPAAWTPAMRDVASLAQRLGRLLIRREVRIQMVEELSDAGHILACYGGGQMTFAAKTLGRRWFDDWQSEAGLAKVVSLVLHELAHENESNHLAEGFYKSIERFSGTVAAKAIADPAFFKPQPAAAAR
jgi:hypothetical protein